MKSAKRSFSRTIKCSHVFKPVTWWSARHPCMKSPNGIKFTFRRKLSYIITLQWLHSEITFENASWKQQKLWPQSLTSTIKTKILNCNSWNVNSQHRSKLYALLRSKAKIIYPNNGKFTRISGYIGSLIFKIRCRFLWRRLCELKSSRKKTS